MRHDSPADAAHSPPSLRRRSLELEPVCCVVVCHDDDVDVVVVVVALMLLLTGTIGGAQCATTQFTRTMRTMSTIDRRRQWTCESARSMLASVRFGVSLARCTCETFCSNAHIHRRQCFLCEHCRQPLTSFVEFDGAAYCKKDYLQLFGNS
jgi:hypothetical protein